MVALHKPKFVTLNAPTEPPSGATHSSGTSTSTSTNTRSNSILS